MSLPPITEPSEDKPSIIPDLLEIYYLLQILSSSPTAAALGFLFLPAISSGKSVIGKKSLFLSWEIEYLFQTFLLVPAERAAEGTGS